MRPRGEGGDDARMRHASLTPSTVTPFFCAAPPPPPPSQFQALLAAAPAVDAAVPTASDEQVRA